MKRDEYKVYFREYVEYRIYLGEAMQWITLKNDAGYYNEHRFSFENLNEPYPRNLYNFDPGVTFRFTCSNQHINLDKVLTQENYQVILPIYPAEVTVPNDTAPRYVLDYIYSDGRRYPLCKGDFRVEK